jgi:hypothetical protein
MLTALALPGPSPAMTTTRDKTPQDNDPWLWLEDVQGERALAWVRERNAEARRVLDAEPGFEAMRAQIREVLDSKEQIPYITRRGDALYNFWRDEHNPRGLWRRTTLAEYRKPAPAWETVLDLDALAKPRARTGSGPAPRCSARVPARLAGTVAWRRRCHGGARVRPARQALRRRRIRAARSQDAHRVDRRRHRLRRHRLRPRLADRLRLPA